ncbi:MAG: major tail protein [Sarcina sp.]
MTTSNKIIRGRFTGLRDIHIADVLQDDSTDYKADNPQLLARAIQAKTAIKTNSSEVDSENSAEYVEDNFESGGLTLDVNDLSPTMKSMLFGHKYNAQTGILSLNIGDKSKPVAIGWRGTRSNSCKQQLRWYYSVTFSPMSETFETSGKTTKAQKSELKGTILGRSKDGKYGVILDEEYIPDNLDVSTVLSTWFSQVVEDVDKVITPN